jgi:LysM repeat protein
MLRKDSPQSVIDSYRKRQQMTPILIWGLVVVLVVVGIIILVVWFAGPGKQGISLFASPTPTETSTFTPSPTVPSLTPTETSTLTATPTVTQTATPAGPFEYTIKEGDTCWDLANKFKVALDVLLALNNFGNACPIKPGDKILIPLEGQELPTDTPIATNLAAGTKINYVVKSGDTLALIASKFDSTVDAIMKENKLTDANTISVGQTLVIPIKIVTPTATKKPTNTITPGGPTLTPIPPTATKTPTPSKTP